MVVEGATACDDMIFYYGEDVEVSTALQVLGVGDHVASESPAVEIMVESRI